jgi:hypothetical protein
MVAIIESVLEMTMLKLAALALAFAAPVVIAAPASAADVKTLRCVEDGMSPAARASLASDMEKNLNNAGSEQSYSPETISAIQGAAKACQAKHGWSDEASQASILFTVAKLGWPTATRIGKSRGIDAKALQRRVRALPAAQREQGTTEEVLTVLATGAIEAKEINESNAALGGAMLGLLALQEKGYADFQKN